MEQASISLDPKQLEEPFSATDLRLLSSVAAQTGLALENGLLTEAIKQEVRALEKHDRELELGREVQERMLPQEYPTIPGLDYVGACRPARSVGGDYYDFIPMPNGELGIAIGDISGKGIQAALLMASLLAFLRGQSIDHETDLSAVIAQFSGPIDGLPTTHDSNSRCACHNVCVSLGLGLRGRFRNKKRVLRIHGVVVSTFSTRR